MLLLSLEINKCRPFGTSGKIFTKTVFLLNMRYLVDLLSLIVLQTFLGIRVEKELQRKQADRKGRRENFGDIKMKKTQQYGKLCSPFQALSVPVS